MKTIEGSLSGNGLRVAIVAGRFNALIVERLIDGAVDALKRSGVADDDITLVRAPGAFEIPGVARRMVEHYDAVVCLGAVIRGSTPHFDYVAGEVAKGVGQLAMQGRAAVVFGVLTTDTIEQAIERAGTKAGNKGYDAAIAAIELANVYKALAAK